MQFLSFDLYSQQNLAEYDEDFLESLPESVRSDVESELEESEKDNERANYRRPSSELSKLEIVKKWERFLELEEQEKKINLKGLDFQFLEQCKLHSCP